MEGSIIELPVQVVLFILSRDYCFPIFQKIIIADTIQEFAMSKNMFFIKVIEQKGMNSDHYFCYSLSFFFISLFVQERREKGKIITKVVVKSHTFLLALSRLVNSEEINKLTQIFLIIIKKTGALLLLYEGHWLILSQGFKMLSF